MLGIDLGHSLLVTLSPSKTDENISIIDEMKTASLEPVK